MRPPRLPRRSAARLSSPNVSPAPYICRTCLSNLPSLLRPPPALRSSDLRLYSSTSSPPKSKSRYAPLTTRRLISLSGPDSTKYLQGSITANLTPSRTAGFYTAFLNAQGRVLNDVFIYPDTVGYARGGGGEGGQGQGNAWLIEVDADEVDKLARHIKRYKLRAKFEIRVLDVQELGVWSIWKEGVAGEATWTAHSLAGENKPSADAADEEISCTDLRAPGMGTRLLLPSSTPPSSSHTLASFAEDATETDELAYRVHRYLKGVPEGQKELLREAALPQESNLDFMGGIDYRKGCYVGQELTIRTHHTGVVRKRVLPMVVYGVGEEVPMRLEWRGNDEGEGEGIAGGVRAEDIPPETGIGRWEKRGRSAGKWLRGVGNLGLGLCRLEVMTDAVKGLEQSEGVGYKGGDEFKVEWEVEGEMRTVKVRAFVPCWHLTK